MTSTEFQTYAVKKIKGVYCAKYMVWTAPERRGLRPIGGLRLIYYKKRKQNHWYIATRKKRPFYQKILSTFLKFGPNLTQTQIFTLN